MVSPKNLRLYFGLTLEDIAKAANVSVQCVNYYEKGIYKRSRLDDYYNGEMFAKLRDEKYKEVVL